MSPATEAPPFHPTHHAGKAAALALRLADAENALHALTSGQVDAIVDPTGRTYLLRPAQEHLRRNEKRLQTVLDSVADAIAVVSRAGVILSGNRAMRRVLGYKPEELEGSVIFKLIHNTDVPLVYCAFITVVEGFDEQAAVRFRHLTRDGSYRLVEATMGKLHDGTADSVVFTLRPATGQPGYTEHASAAPQPAAVLDGVQSPDGARAFEESPRSVVIPSGIARQAQLLERWDDVATAGRYAVRLQLASTNAHGDVRLVLEVEQSKADGTRIEVLIDLHGSNHVVLADPLQLQQAMWSLVKDAIKSFDQDSRVSDVSANRTEGELAQAQIVPRSHVEPELLAVVFGSLQQGVDAMQRLYDSLRFGLFIAKGIAEAQRGTLTVANDAIDQNGAFRLNFKVTSSAAA